MEKNYSIVELGTFNKDLVEKGRVMVGEDLALTGVEISFNHTPAGGFTPFVHAHKLNEEIYIVLSGTGKFMVDDEEFPIKEGSVIRVAPEGERAIKADTDMTHICIQAQKGSLTQSTGDDGIISETKKASWMTK